MQKLSKCPRCDTSMELKGAVEGFSDDGSIIFYQCPNCKNIQIYAKQFNNQMRMAYP